MPINLAVSMGAEEVLAIDLDGPGIIRKEKTYGVPVRYIRSYWSLGPFLWFEPELSRRNMALGYLDAKRSYGLSEGTAYAFAPGTAAKLKKEYLAPVRRLLEKFRSWNEGIELRNQAMERTMLFRLQRALRKRRGGLRSAEELLLAGIEIAGDFPNCEYSGVDSFFTRKGTASILGILRDMDSMSASPSAFTVLRIRMSVSLGSYMKSQPFKGDCITSKINFQSGR